MSFRMNAIVKNGPVVDTTNFELGIAGDRELGNRTRCYTKKLIKD
jgi:hypothetical protein